MKIENFLTIKDLQLLTKLPIERDVNDIYCCDLLSFVLGHVKEKNTMLITIINSMNVIAVASLLEMSAVVFCEGVTPSEKIIEKAIEEKILLFKTDLSSAKLLKVIYESIL